MTAASLRRSAFFRFAVWLPLAVGLLALLSMWPIYHEAVGHIRAEARAGISRDSWDLEVQFHEEGLAGLVARIEERLARELAPGDLYLLVDADGRRLAGNLDRWPPGLERQDRHFAQFLTADGRAAEGQVLSLFGRRSLLVARVSPLVSFDRHLAVQLLWTALAMLAVAALAAAWFSARLRRRLQALAAEADAVRSGDFTGRLAVAARGDEIDELAARFNAGFADLQRLVEGMRGVASHLAHDLRRPLQGLRQRLDEIARRATLDAATRAELEGGLHEVDSLLATFAALLRLSRLQSGAYERSSESIDLDRVASDAVALYAPVAAQAGREILARIAPCRLAGDRHLWFQLLQNLLENALDHGGGAIELELAPGRLCVRDHGAGVPEAALAHLGERFFRADPARSGPGAGIGLALVRAIAAHHGAQVVFANAQPGLAVQVLWEPAAIVG